MVWTKYTLLSRVQAPRNGTSPSISSNNQHPSVVDETRLPDQRSVAPFKEVPDETFPAKVVLHLAGTFDDGLHSPAESTGDPWARPSSAPSRGGFRGGGGRTVWCSNHCASIAGSSSTPRGTQRASRIKSRSRHRGNSHFSERDLPCATIFALISSRAVFARRTRGG